MFQKFIERITNPLIDCSTCEASTMFNSQTFVLPRGLINHTIKTCPTPSGWELGVWCVLQFRLRENISIELNVIILSGHVSCGMHTTQFKNLFLFCENYFQFWTKRKQILTIFQWTNIVLGKRYGLLFSDLLKYFWIQPDECLCYHISVVLNRPYQMKCSVWGVWTRWDTITTWLIFKHLRNV